MVGDIEFGNYLTEGTSVESEMERIQYRALGDTEAEHYSIRETITYFNFFVYGLKVKI